MSALHGRHLALAMPFVLLFLMLDLFVVFVLVLVNGCFALSELAIVSSRRPQLRAMAESGNTGARAALVMAENPGRFLSYS